MTDIIPKASSGRYMGMATSPPLRRAAFALIIGGPLIDIVGGVDETGEGPRAAVLVGAVFFVVGGVPAATGRRAASRGRSQPSTGLVGEPPPGDAAVSPAAAA